MRNQNKPSLPTGKNGRSCSKNEHRDEWTLSRICALYIICFLIVWLMLEHILPGTVASVLVKEIAWAVAVPVAFCVEEVIRNNGKEIFRNRKSGRTIAEDARRIIKLFIRTITKSTVLFLMVACISIIFAPAVLAQYQVSGRIIAFCRAGIDIEKGMRAFVDYGDSKEQDVGQAEHADAGPKIKSTLEQAGTDGGWPEDGAKISEESKNQKEEKIGSGENWFYDHPVSEQNEAIRLRISEFEREQELEMSEDVYNQVFLQRGIIKSMTGIIRKRLRTA